MHENLHQIPRTLAGAVVQGIREHIVTGKLRLGSKIDQTRLAKEFGISVVPLREALRKLEAEGLVRIIPHRGAFVSRISRDELEDLYAIRETLEEMVTRAAVPRLTSEDLVRLGELTLEMERETRAEQNDYAHLLRLNREFHLTIYKVSGRRFLCETITGLWEKSALYRSLYVYLPGRSAQALEEHREILRALQNRWVTGAVRAVRNNIRQTMVGLLSAFDRSRESEVSPAETGLPDQENF
jgi:DNA-binding GntR family transcriptional regulator